MNTNPQKRRDAFVASESPLAGRVRRRLIDAALAVTCCTLLFLGICAMPTKAVAAETGQAKATIVPVEGLLGQGNIQFLGPMTEQQAGEIARPKDAMLLKVNRRLLAGPGRSPREFYMLAKRMNPLEGDMLADAMDGQWNTCDQFHAALVAEGNRTPREIARMESRMDQIVREMRQRLDSAEAAEEGAAARTLTENLFRYLHENVLTAKYDINCTDPGQVLETGRYNCVSATLFFNVLAERVGLNACALEMPGHALSRVSYATLQGPRSFDLETTYAGWFSLRTDEQRRAATESKIASNAAPQPYTVAKPVVNANGTAELPVPTKKLRELTPVQFIAIIYYNQGFDHLNANRYPEAIAANIKALQLDPESENAWKNLMAAINNWAIACIDKNQNRFDLAAELLDYGVQLDETYEMFRANQRSVYYQWILSLGNEGRIDDAMTVYRFAEERLPNDAALKSLADSFRKAR